MCLQISVWFHHCFFLVNSGFSFSFGTITYSSCEDCLDSGLECFPTQALPSFKMIFAQTWKYIRIWVAMLDFRVTLTQLCVLLLFLLLKVKQKPKDFRNYHSPLTNGKFSLCFPFPVSLIPLSHSLSNSRKIHEALSVCKAANSALQESTDLDPGLTLQALAFRRCWGLVEDGTNIQPLKNKVLP